MILSDRDIRAAISEGRIGIEPFNEADIQPSSVDLHVDRFFRTFNNHRYQVIDVKEPMEGLTELIEVKENEAFILHPGEFVLGSTAEYVRLPKDLVARLEGKSSLGRLGLLIHSSLPGDEPVLLLHDGQLSQIPIRDIVRKQLEGRVVSFDPETFEVGYHEVTGWHETKADRIFEVCLASGRRVNLTGAHALFTINSNGALTKVRVHELAEGLKVAIPGRIPAPVAPSPTIDILALAPEASYPSLVLGGPAIAALFKSQRGQVAEVLAEHGIRHVSYYERTSCLPLQVALQLTDLRASQSKADWIAVKGARRRMPLSIKIDSEIAWLLGLYVAEGSRRRNQAVFSNTDQDILDRAEACLRSWGISMYRSAGAITCCSGIFALLLEWLEMGPYALSKRIPLGALGWPEPLQRSLLEGFVDGDGSREDFRTSLWTSSDDLVGDFLYLCARLGERAGSSFRKRGRNRLWQIYIPIREHKLLLSIPECSNLMVSVRQECGVTQRAAANAAGFKHNTQLCNVERQHAALSVSTVRALREAYEPFDPPSLPLLSRLVDGDLRWDRVTSVRDTGRVEPVFDLEVRPAGRKIENFLAGRGGVFVSNTAGYVDPGFEGHLTLELSNVANLPITLYPNMKIGQISFFKLTSEAENPYGSGKIGSKYQGQRGPTASRYHENF